MENVLSHTNKVILEGGQGGNSVVPYLPLPGLDASKKDQGVPQ